MFDNCMGPSGIGTINIFYSFYVAKVLRLQAGSLPELSGLELMMMMMMRMTMMTTTLILSVFLVIANTLISIVLAILAT